MNDANLFQLGIGPETGAHAEECIVTGATGAAAVIAPDFTESPAKAVPDSSAAAAEPGRAEAHAGPERRDIFDDERADHFVRRDGRIFAGTHLIIEVANGTGLDDAARIEAAFREIVDASGATLLHIHLHKFTPQGVSGVAVLAESHISVHTWPEIGYGAFDVFMCGDARPEEAIPVLERVFATSDVQVKTLYRGEEIVPAALATPQGAQAPGESGAEDGAERKVAHVA